MERPSSSNPLRSSPAHPELAEQATYTTVGSVYTPNSAVPLQPPTRRGRTLRWQNANHFDLAGLPRTLLSNLSLRHTFPRSPPPTTSSLQQYAPLQQNYDRAATPLPDQERDAFVGLDLPGLNLGFENMPSTGATAPPGFETATSYEQHVEANDGDEDIQAIEDILTAHQFTAKALTNLSSYENPMQRAAQKMLARARPALSAATNLPRLTMPPPLPVNTVSDLTGDRLSARMTLRSSLSDSQFPMGSDMHSEARGRLDRDSDYHRAGTPAQREQDRMAKIGGGGLASGSSGFSTLLKAPGAPQPLTAGPPGLRQYRPSTFEGTFKALHQSAEASSQAASDEGPQHGHPLPVGHGRPGSVVSTTNFRLAHDGQAASHYAGSEADRRFPNPITRVVARRRKVQAAIGGSGNRIVDTLNYHEVHQYYPRGAPVDFRKEFRPIEHDWAKKTELEVSYNGYEKSSEMLRIRNAVVDAHFYAGTPSLGKSSDTIIREAEQRHFNKQKGPDESDSTGRRFHPYGVVRTNRVKHEYRHLSIDEAKNMPAAVHAEPILNMVFASLLSYMEDGGSKGHLSGFEVPEDSRLIDASKEGQKSFWDRSEAGASQQTTR